MVFPSQLAIMLAGSPNDEVQVNAANHQLNLKGSKNDTRVEVEREVKGREN